MLLLHGGGVAGWMWNSLRQRLEAQHVVVVPDLPGHGRSGGEAYVSHGATVAGLADLLEYSTAEGPAAVIGFSLGAQLAVGLASSYPELVNRVVVVSAQAKPIPLPGLTLHLLGAATPLARRRWFAELQARELYVPAHLLEDYISGSVAMTRDTLVAAVGHNLRFRLPPGWSDFPGRALVMVGQRERRLMRDSAADIHHALPTSELEVVEGCGHGIPLQRPDWFNTRVSGWLSQP